MFESYGTLLFLLPNWKVVITTPTRADDEYKKKASIRPELTGGYDGEVMMNSYENTSLFEELALLETEEEDLDE